MCQVLIVAIMYGTHHRLFRKFHGGVEMRRKRLSLLHELSHYKPPSRCVREERECEHLQHRLSSFGFRRFRCVLDNAMDGRNKSCRKFIATVEPTLRH